jgi:hypothetical protein
VPAHIREHGSLVDAKRARVDFSQESALTEAQMAKVQARVRAEIPGIAAGIWRVVRVWGRRPGRWPPCGAGSSTGVEAVPGKVDHASAAVLVTGLIARPM